MNRQRAYNILQLKEEDINEEKDIAIKKQYHKLALLYHPDKSKGNEQKFIEINDAYKFLSSSSADDPLPSSYIVILETFINHLYANNPTPMRKFAKEIVAIYADYCNNKDDPNWSLTEHLNKLDDNILIPLFEFTCRYKHLLYIASDFVDKMEKCIKNSSQSIELVYRLTPSLEDLFNCKVYKLNIDNSTYFVPLWQPVNYFDLVENPAKEFMVICEPILNTTQQIDEDNNLHIQLTIDLNDLCKYLDSGIYTYTIASSGHEFNICLDDLRITTQMQMVRFNGRGIPKFNVDDETKENRGDVIFYIYLTSR